MKRGLSSSDFPEFFRDLWGYSPFPWQAELAARLCEGRHPMYVAAPTGAGKTASIEAAIFALAVQSKLPHRERTVGRRIFFIVNRRIIVDEAFYRALKLREKLNSAVDGVVASVAAALCEVGSNARGNPLECVELRGGIYRDRAWTTSPVQPMIICSTVDQVGSRLLFRGYGVSDQARPIHAALVSQDSLLIVDEAHISEAFLQTLENVERYRTWKRRGKTPVALSFGVIRMTATPPSQADEKDIVRITDDDRRTEPLKERISAAKRATLVLAKKGKLITDIVSHAKALFGRGDIHRLAVMVNRVGTAREVQRLLAEIFPADRVHLVIGRMRPIDRSRVEDELACFKTRGLNMQNMTRGIVVATQCLEVGADLDFDALVTECASIDALRQRFGRLDRGGTRNVSDAVILMREEQNVVDEKLVDAVPIDPVYGNSIPRVWSWLNSLAKNGVIDFGISAMDESIARLRNDNESLLNSIVAPRVDAAVLLPAYLDAWVQTNPSPSADPDVSLFLHGPGRQMTDVQVCWRADLPAEAGESAWVETVSLCPPTTLECLATDICDLRSWLSGDEDCDTADAPSSIMSDREGRASEDRPFLIWRGPEKSEYCCPVRNIRPGDTIVLRVSDAGWDKLGYVPTNSRTLVDVAEIGIRQLRRKAVLRFHPSLWPDTTEGSAINLLLKWSGNQEFDWRSGEVAEALSAAAKELIEKADPRAEVIEHLARFSHDIDAVPYPVDSIGALLRVKKPMPGKGGTVEEEGADEPLLLAPRSQFLDEHTEQVEKNAAYFCRQLGLEQFTTDFGLAAKGHDLGKADPRFQAVLVGGDINAGYAIRKLFAKSAKSPASSREWNRARERAGLPRGFRHEMISVAIMQLGRAIAMKGANPDLALHLVASHHGWARPNAPIVNDADSSPIRSADSSVWMTSEERLAFSAQALDSGVSERFWRLTREHGWWGLALLETIVRLADQQASAEINDK